MALCLIPFVGIAITMFICMVITAAKVVLLGAFAQILTQFIQKIGALWCVSPTQSPPPFLPQPLNPHIFFPLRRARTTRPLEETLAAHVYPVPRCVLSPYCSRCFFTLVLFPFAHPHPHTFFNAQGTYNPSTGSIACISCPAVRPAPLCSRCFLPLCFSLSLTLTHTPSSIASSHI